MDVNSLISSAGDSSLKGSSAEEGSLVCPYRSRFSTYLWGFGGTVGGVAVGLVGALSSPQNPGYLNSSEFTAGACGGAIAMSGFMIALMDYTRGDLTYPWTDKEKRNARTGVVIGGLVSLAASAAYSFFQ